MISINNISKRYPKANKTALDSFTFEVKTNEIICLLGPNGAGKTTLIKCLTGLIIPDSGDIFIDDKKISYNKNFHMKDIAVVLEGARNLYWRVTVKSNFYYFGALKGINKSVIDERLKKYGYIFEIDELINLKVNTLSLGQKQKVAILSCILMEPKILILDEPSNGLDIESKQNLFRILLDIKKTINTTFLIASHDVDFARKFVDRFVIIKEGQAKKIIINNSLTNNLIEEEYFKIISI
jgi:ABC-2 type transport system ATP-binding protein